jgi:hypothetical protein
MKFRSDGKHDAYQPHIVRAPVVPPPPSPPAAAAGTSVAAHGSPATASLARALPTHRHAPSATPESSRAATH